MSSSPFLYIQLDDNNCFYAQSFVELYGKTLGCRFKIDSGCSLSTIPFRRLTNLPELISRQYKKKAISDGLQYVRSYGVSDDSQIRKKDRDLLDQGNLMDCKALKFLHNDVNMNIGGYDIVSDVYVNYDRVGNPLIGMDILRNFTFICDVSALTGEYVFIGCLKNQKNKDDYYDAVRNHFGLIKTV